MILLALAYLNKIFFIITIMKLFLIDYNFLKFIMLFQFVLKIIYFFIILEPWFSSIPTICSSIGINNRINVYMLL